MATDCMLPKQVNCILENVLCSDNNWFKKQKNGQLQNRLLDDLKHQLLSTGYLKL